MKAIVVDFQNIGIDEVELKLFTIPMHVADIIECICLTISLMDFFYLMLYSSSQFLVELFKHKYCLVPKRYFSISNFITYAYVISPSLTP